MDVVWSSVPPLALAVPRSRWFSLSLSLVRVRCWFWSFRVAAVSFARNVGSRLVLVCVCPVAFGVGFGRSDCAAVSFHLFLGSAPRVGRPSRN